MRRIRKLLVMDGILSINKPAGLTSHDVVSRVRRACQTKRAGHAGTLDPDATGVLVVAVGQATRLLPHLLLEPKVYTARVCFGASTTTEDASGTVESEADASRVTEAAVRAVLPRFIGDILQVPPMVSALHHEGRRLYDLAREGVTVERAARPVVIHQIAMRDFTPGTRAEATLTVTCGGGTYIRTLCKDIGAALGVPAHMKSLVRDAVGPFRLTDAVPLADLSPESARAALVPMERVLPFPVEEVGAAQAQEIGFGRAIAGATQPPLPPAEEVALLHDGVLLALVKSDGNGLLHPFKVFTVNRGDAP